MQTSLKSKNWKGKDDVDMGMILKLTSGKLRACLFVYVCVCVCVCVKTSNGIKHFVRTYNGAICISDINLSVLLTKYRAFHNVLRDCTHL